MLTVAERFAKLQERQQSTYNEMCSCLDEFGLCCVERPTGFGKTKLFMDYAKANADSKILYIYDTNSAKSDIKASYATNNVEFMSYRALSIKKSHDSVMQHLLSQPYHTIIFDEAHLMGGENIKKILDTLIPLAVAAGVYILGGTATRLRTDLVDVSHHFFKDHGVSEYTMLDAIEDGIMLEPVWCATVHYKALLRSVEKYSNANSFVRTSYSQLTKAYAKLDGVSTVYRETVKQVYEKIPVSMRFIIFYPDIKSIDENFQRDIEEFSKAFPNHRIEYGLLSSSSNHMSTITEVEQSFSGVGKRVQLIFAVNMLNQAYHSVDLTGIVMYRSTLSNIIFTQELGRIMSVMAKFPGIVFDNVGNVFIRPDVAMAGIQTFTGIPSGTKRERGHLELRLRASKELVEFQKVYHRIMATREITQEQIDYAKYIIRDMNAPIELVMQGLRLTKDVAESLVQNG